MVPKMTPEKTVPCSKKIAQSSISCSLIVIIIIICGDGLATCSARDCRLNRRELFVTCLGTRLTSKEVMDYVNEKCPSAL